MYSEAEGSYLIHFVSLALNMTFDLPCFQILTNTMPEWYSDSKGMKLQMLPKIGASSLPVGYPKQDYLRGLLISAEDL